MNLLIICRLALQTFIWKLGKTPTKSQRLEAFKWRDWLQHQVDAFHTQVAAYWIKDVALQEEFVYNSTNSSKDSDDDNSDYSENGLVTSILLSGPKDPERVPICLPSHFRRETIHDRSICTFVQLELKLWEGQANDALQDFHLSLSRKSVLYCTSLHHQKLKKGKTQSWQEIHKVASTANHFAKVYTQVHDQMVYLSAPSIVMKCYQVLEKEHLNVTTITIDPSQRGKRHGSLAWF